MPKTRLNLSPADIKLLKIIFLTKQDAENFLTKQDAKNFLTKQDAKDFLTKSDAKQFATKDDLKQFATKDDLQRLATTNKDDLNEAINRIFNYINKNFATKQELTEVKQLIGNLPTKEEFFSRMDKLSSEYTTFLQEKTILMHRFEQLEQKLAATVN